MLTKACELLSYNLQPERSSDLSEKLRIAVWSKLAQNMDNQSVRNMLLDFLIKFTKDKKCLVEMISESKITIT